MTKTLNLNTEAQLWSPTRKRVKVSYGKREQTPTKSSSLHGSGGVFSSPIRRSRISTPDLSSDISGGIDDMSSSSEDEENDVKGLQLIPNDSKKRESGLWNDKVQPQTTRKRRLDATSDIIDIYGTPSRRTHPQSKSKSRLFANKKRNVQQSQLEQTFLDFGQKTLGPIRCPDCGMMYQRGKEDDEALHDIHHKSSVVTSGHIHTEQQKHLKGSNNQIIPKLSLPPNSWKEADQIAQFPFNTIATHNSTTTPPQIPSNDDNKKLVNPKTNDPFISKFARFEKGISSHHPSQNSKNNNSHMVSIIKVDYQSSKPLKRRALEILNTINDQLGAVHLTSQEFEKLGRKIYLFVSLNDRIIDGCVLAEQIKSKIGYRVLTNQNNVNCEDDTSNIQISTEKKYPVVCGISRIWTSPRCRRMNVASTLLDAIRKNFVYGCPLKKSDLAFTQPTQSGRRLAESYFGKRNFLVYIEED